MVDPPPTRYPLPSTLQNLIYMDFEIVHKGGILWKMR
jgi:hypothetical protein